MAKKEAEKGGNILNNPQERQKFKSALSAVTHYYQIIDQQKEAIKENVVELSQMYGLDKKLIRKLITTMYKHNYASIQEENEHFAALYEIIIEGKLSQVRDPLDEVAGTDEE